MDMKKNRLIDEGIAQGAGIFGEIGHALDEGRVERVAAAVAAINDGVAQVNEALSSGSSGE